MNKKYLKQQFGFTLIELLIASFIFASVVALVYSLLTEAMASKKELELTLSINEKVKNVNEILQSTVREANGKFPFCEQSNLCPEGFFVLKTYEKPNNLNMALYSSQVVQITANIRNNRYQGKVLYIRNKEKNEIYIFRMDEVVNTAAINNAPTFYMEKWVATERGWERQGEKSAFFQFDSSQEENFYFEIPVTYNENSNPPTYRQNTCNQPAFDSWVRLKIIVKARYGQEQFIRELDQIYAPLALFNPYL